MRVKKNKVAPFPHKIKKSLPFIRYSVLVLQKKCWEKKSWTPGTFCQFSIWRTRHFAAGCMAATRTQRREKRRLEALKTLIQLKETKQNNNTLSPPHGNSWLCRGSSVSTLRVPSRMVAILFYFSKHSRNTPSKYSVSKYAISKYIITEYAISKYAISKIRPSQ